MQRAARALAEIPKNWILERSRAPSMVLAWIILAAGPWRVLGQNFGLHLVSPGVDLGLIWGTGKIPMAVSSVKAWRMGTFRRWNRPQAFQRQDVLHNTLAGSTSRGMRFAQRCADLWDAAIRRSVVCGALDDWVNERVRLPGFALEMSMTTARFVGNVPWSVAFGASLLVGELPKVKSVAHGVRALSAGRGWRVALARLTRPGSFRRPGFVHDAQTRRLTIEGRVIARLRGQSVVPASPPSVPDVAASPVVLRPIGAIPRRQLPAPRPVALLGPGSPAGRDLG